MGKKSKNNSNNRFQPNAPDLNQILLEQPAIQQPPHNPYYPNLGVVSQQLNAPPPYSDLSTSFADNNSVAMSRINNLPASNYTRFQQQHSQHVPTTVIVQQPSNRQHDRAEKYHKKVKKFNTQLMLGAIIAFCSSIYAHSLYDNRNCVSGFIVHQPAKDVNITISQVREMHLFVVYMSIFILFLCLAKASTGRSKSYACYMFLIGLATLITAVFTGYLAYLTFYSPCSLKLAELATNAVRTIMGSFEKIPSPEKGVFNESNVFQLYREDKSGLTIFLIDIFNFMTYLTFFVNATMLC